MFLRPSGDGLTNDVIDLTLTRRKEQAWSKHLILHTSYIYLILFPSTFLILYMSSFPDYYALLNVSKTATAEEIRQAYKRESLRCFDSHG